MVELPPAGGLEEEDAEVAVALEVARDKDDDVKPAATLVRRQTEVSLVDLSLKNCTGESGPLCHRSVLHRAPSAVV